MTETKTTQNLDSKEQNHHADKKKIALSLGILVLFFLYAYFINNADAIAPGLEDRFNQLIALPIFLEKYTPSSKPAGFLAANPAEPIQRTPSYRDGNYSGFTVDAFYGPVQATVLIHEGKIANADFLKFPNDRPHSIDINSYGIPLLINETLKAQSEKIDIVSGATLTSDAFEESLASALAKAQE